MLVGGIARIPIKCEAIKFISQELSKSHSFTWNWFKGSLSQCVCMSVCLCVSDQEEKGSVFVEELGFFRDYQHLFEEKLVAFH
jgi:hypothetical protein